MASLKETLNNLFGQKTERFWLLIGEKDELNLRNAQPLEGAALQKKLEDVITKGARKKGELPIKDAKQTGPVRPLQKNDAEDSLVKRGENIWQNVSVDDVRKAFLNVSKRQNIIINRLPDLLQEFAKEMEDAGELRNDYAPDPIQINSNDREHIESVKEKYGGKYPFVKDKFYELIGLSTINDKYYNTAGLHVASSMEDAAYRQQIVRELVDKAENHYGKPEKEQLSDGGVFTHVSNRDFLDLDNVVSTPDAIVSPEEKAVYDRNADVRSFDDGYSPRVSARLERLPADDRYHGDGKAAHDVAFDWDKGVAYVFREVSRDKYINALRAACNKYSHYDNYESKDVYYTLKDVKDGNYLGEHDEDAYYWIPNAAAGLAAGQEMERLRAKDLEKSRKYRAEVGRRLGEGFSWHADPEKKDEIHLYHKAENGDRIDEGSIISISTRLENDKPVPVIDIVKDGHIEHDVPFEKVEVDMGHHGEIEDFLSDVEDRRYMEFLSKTKARNRDRYYVPLFTVKPGDENYRQMSKDNYLLAVDMVDDREEKSIKGEIPSLVDDIALRGTNRGFPLSMKEKDTHLVYDHGGRAVTKSVDGTLKVFAVVSDKYLSESIHNIPNIANDYKYMSISADLKHIVNKEAFTPSKSSGHSELYDIDFNLIYALKGNEDFNRNPRTMNRDTDPLKFAAAVALSVGPVKGLVKDYSSSNILDNYSLVSDKSDIKIKYLLPEDKKALTDAVNRQTQLDRSIRNNVGSLRDTLSPNEGIKTLHVNEFENRNLSGHRLLSFVEVNNNSYTNADVKVQAWTGKYNHYGNRQSEKIDLSTLTQDDWRIIKEGVKKESLKQIKSARLTDESIRSMMPDFGKERMFVRPVKIGGIEYSSIKYVSTKNREAHPIGNALIPLDNNGTPKEISTLTNEEKSSLNRQLIKDQQQRDDVAKKETAPEKMYIAPIRAYTAEAVEKAVSMLNNSEVLVKNAAKFRSYDLKSVMALEDFEEGYKSNDMKVVKDDIRQDGRNFLVLDDGEGFRYVYEKVPESKLLEKVKDEYDYKNSSFPDKWSLPAMELFTKNSEAIKAEKSKEIADGYASRLGDYHFKADNLSYDSRDLLRINKDAILTDEEVYNRAVTGIDVVDGKMTVTIARLDYDKGNKFINPKQYKPEEISPADWLNVVGPALDGVIRENEERDKHAVNYDSGLEVSNNDTLKAVLDTELENPGKGETFHHNLVLGGVHYWAVDRDTEKGFDENVLSQYYLNPIEEGADRLYLDDLSDEQKAAVISHLNEENLLNENFKYAVQRDNQTGNTLGSVISHPEIPEREGRWQNSSKALNDVYDSYADLIQWWVDSEMYKKPSMSRHFSFDKDPVKAMMYSIYSDYKHFNNQVFLSEKEIAEKGLKLKLYEPPFPVVEGNGKEAHTVNMYNIDQTDIWSRMFNDKDPLESKKSFRKIYSELIKETKGVPFAEAKTSEIADKLSILADEYPGNEEKFHNPEYLKEFLSSSSKTLIAKRHAKADDLDEDRDDSISDTISQTRIVPRSNTPTSADLDGNGIADNQDPADISADIDQKTKTDRAFHRHM